MSKFNNYNYLETIHNTKSIPFPPHSNKPLKKFSGEVDVAAFSPEMQALVDILRKRKYEIDENPEDNEVNVTNRYGNEIFISERNGKFYTVVQGYKNDIHLDEISKDPREILKLINGISMKWMREFDPYGDRW